MMINKPWFQILFFVIVSNAVQMMLMYMGAVMGSELAIFGMLLFSCFTGTVLLTSPQSATTAHKLLTLTYAAATIYFSAAVIATTWALYGSLLAWGVYMSIHNSFPATMQLFTGLEIVCVFANAGTNMGRVGELFERGIDYMYDSIFMRALYACRIQRV